jgi:hypothetical protein
MTPLGTGSVFKGDTVLKEACFFNLEMVVSGDGTVDQQE